jgi:PII-like signaling protein
VEFFLVYVQEAHPTDGRQAKKNITGGVLYRRHRTFDERVQVAQSCALDLDLTLPVLVDDMSNTTDEAYGAVPERLYLIGMDGTVAYRGGAGPHFFDLDDWHEAIQSYLDSKRAGDRAGIPE